MSPRVTLVFFMGAIPRPQCREGVFSDLSELRKHREFGRSGQLEIVRQSTKEEGTNRERIPETFIASP